MLQLLKKGLFYLLLGLLALVLLVLVFRVSLINYAIKQYAPEGMQASISSLDLKPWSRTVGLGGLELSLVDPGSATNLELELAELSLSGIGFSFDPSAHWQQLALLDLKLSVDANTELSFDKLELNAGAWSEAQGATLEQLVLSGVQLSHAEPELIANLNQLLIEQIALDAKETLSIKRLALSQTSLLLAEKADTPELSLNVEEIALANIISDLNQSLTLEDVTLKHIAADIDTWQWQLALTEFALEQIRVSGLSQAQDTSNAGAPDVDLALLRLSELTWQTGLDEAATQALALDGLDLAQIALRDHVLSMQTLSLAKLDIHAINDAKGQINLMPLAPANDDMQAEQAPPQQAAQEDAQEQSPKQDEDLNYASNDESKDQSESKEESKSKQKQENPTPVQHSDDKQAESELIVRLAQFSLDAPATLRWQDKSVSPAVDQTLVLNEVALKNLSTLATDDAAQLVLKGVLGLHTALEMKASLHPSNSPDDMAVKFNLAKLELPPFSGYAEQATGYALESGQFNFDLDMQIAKSQLSGEAKLDTYNVVMRSEDEAVSARINKELTMPLPIAMNLLEDADKRISLTMPLKGSLDDPAFSWSGIMRFIMLKAVRKASVYYLKQAILPQTTLVSLVDMFGGAVYNKLTQLPALPYQASVVTLSKEHKTLLDQVAKTMQKKEKLHFRLCATANKKDGAKAQALALADQRVVNIRRYLSDEKGIASQRLLSCLSKYDAQAEQSDVQIKL